MFTTPLTLPAPGEAMTALPSPEEAPPMPGTPAVAAKQGEVCLFQVQPEGKKPMTGAAFLNGYPDLKGAVLESVDPTAQKK